MGQCSILANRGSWNAADGSVCAEAEKVPYEVLYII